MPSITGYSYVETPVGDIKKALRKKRYCLALLFLSIHIESRLRRKLTEYVRPRVKINDNFISKMPLGKLIKIHSKSSQGYTPKYNYVDIDKRYIKLLREINKVRNQKVAHSIYWWYETRKKNQNNDAKKLIKDIKNLCKRGLKLYFKL